MGSNPCRRLSLLGFAHPVVGPPFRYRECVEIWRSLEVDIKKEAGLWISFRFCKTCIRMLNFDICFVYE